MPLSKKAPACAGTGLASQQVSTPIFPVLNLALCLFQCFDKTSSSALGNTLYSAARTNAFRLKIRYTANNNFGILFKPCGETE